MRISAKKYDYILQNFDFHFLLKIFSEVLP
jgi:hypothetical protein